MADHHCERHCSLKAAVKNGTRVMHTRDGEGPSLAATVIYLVEVAYKFCAVYYVHVSARRSDSAYHRTKGFRWRGELKRNVALRAWVPTPTRV